MKMIVICGRRVRGPATDPLISPAKRAHPGFNALHQLKGESALPFSGTATDRTVGAEPGQGFVE
jgi:hypothetical protein